MPMGLLRAFVRAGLLHAHKPAPCFYAIWPASCPRACPALLCKLAYQKCSLPMIRVGQIRIYTVYLWFWPTLPSLLLALCVQTHRAAVPCILLGMNGRRPHQNLILPCPSYPTTIQSCALTLSFTLALTALEHSHPFFRFNSAGAFSPFLLLSQFWSFLTLSLASTALKLFHPFLHFDSSEVPVSKPVVGNMFD